MFQLDLRSGIPICDQIVNGFIKLKALGVLSGGQRLPSVRSLALKFSVNPNTVQKAYAILESEGIIYSVKGKGSFVSENDDAAKSVINRAKEDFGSAVKSAKEIGLEADTLRKIIKNIYEEENKC